MLIEKYRELLVEYGCRCLHEGLTSATGGNLSVRDPETGLVAIKPSNMDYDKLTPEDIPVVDINGTMIEGKYKPSSELPMHTIIYRNRPDIFAAIHVHSYFATSFAVANREVPILTQDIAELAIGSIRVAPFQVPGSIELGQSVVESFGDSDVVLMQNHGSMAVATTLKLAFSASCALERACAAYYYALQLGQVTVIPDQVNKSMRKDYQAYALKVA
jgi:L-ribulose-5-phosphate 4-epimerase